MSILCYTSQAYMVAITITPTLCVNFNQFLIYPDLSHLLSIGTIVNSDDQGLWPCVFQFVRTKIAPTSRITVQLASGQRNATSL